MYTDASFSPTSIGLSAFNGLMTAEIPADFDYFTLRPVFTFPQWKRSELWTGDEVGPHDANGRAWSDPNFDDTSWTGISLPDGGPSTVAPTDQYYRAHFTWDGKSTLSLGLLSDDGLKIFINGVSWNSWGNGWRQAGCVNNPPDGCLLSVSVPLQTIPSEYLLNGDNIIAVDLWNEGGSYYLDVLPHDINLLSSIYLPFLAR